MTVISVGKLKNAKKQKPISVDADKVVCSSEEGPRAAAIIENVLRIIGGKWKVLIVFHLHQNGVIRFGEMKRKIPGITQRILTNQLREMEKDGLVVRKIYPQIPPKVEYSLSPEGEALKTVFVEMRKWGEKNSKFLTKTIKSQEAELKASNS